MSKNVEKSKNALEFYNFYQNNIFAILSFNKNPLLLENGHQKSRKSGTNVETSENTLKIYKKNNHTQTTIASFIHTIISRFD